MPLVIRKLGLPRSRSTAQFSDIFSLTFVLGILLLVSEVPLVASLLTASLFLYLTICGTALISTLLPTTTRLTNISLGAVTSIILWTLIDQVLRTSVFRPAGLLFLGVTTYLAIRSNQIKQNTHDSSLQQKDVAFNQSHLILVAVTSTVLLLAQHWSWILIPGCLALVLMLAHCLADKTLGARRSKVAVLSAGLILLSLALSSLYRKDYWWLPKYGMDEFEYLSQGAYTWGPRLDVLASNIPSGYQWFHYATAGLIENTVQSGDWVFATRIDFVLSALLVAMIVLALFSEFFESKKSITVATALSMVVMTPLFYPNQYALFTPNHRGLVAVLLVAALLSSLVWQKAQYSWRALVPVLLFVFALTASKTVVVVPVAITFGVVGMAFAYSRNWKLLPKIASVYGVLLLAITITVRSSSGLSTDFRQPARFISTYIGFDLYTKRLLGSPMQQLFLGLTTAVVLLGMSGLAWITIIQLRRFSTGRGLSVVLAATVFLGSVIAIFGMRLSETHMHFLQIPVVASIPLGVMASMSSLSVVWQDKNRPILFFYFISIVLGIGVCLVALRWDFMFFEARHAIVGSIGMFVLLLICSVGSQIFRKSKVNSSKISWVGLTLSSLLIFTATLGVTNWFTIPRQSLFKSGYAQGQLGTQGLQNIARWVSENTKSDDILATNIGIGTELSQFGCTNPVPQQDDSYITLVTLTKRRFFVTGSGIASLTTGANLENRISSSLKFSCTADQPSLEILKLNGVTYFVGFLANMSNSLKSNLRFQTEDYGILDIAMIK